MLLGVYGRVCRKGEEGVFVCAKEKDLTWKVCTLLRCVEVTRVQVGMKAGEWVCVRDKGCVRNVCLCVGGFISVSCAVSRVLSSPKPTWNVSGDVVFMSKV